MPAGTGERMMHRGVVVPRSSLVKMLLHSSEPKQAFGAWQKEQPTSTDCGWIDEGWILLRSPPLASLVLFGMR
jgi:hypothetical protein